MLFSHLSLYAHPGHPRLRDVERPHPHRLPDQDLFVNQECESLLDEPVDKSGHCRLRVSHPLLWRAQVSNHHHLFQFFARCDLRLRNQVAYRINL